MNNRPRTEWIDAARGIALVLIIWSHTMGGFAMQWVDTPLVPVFWLTAGYFARPGFALSKRFRKIMVPYAWLSALCLIYTYFHVHTPLRWLKILFGVCYARFDVMSDLDPALVLMRSSFNAVLWFLPSLFTGYCVLHFILRGSLRRQLYFAIASFAVGYALSFLPILLPWSIDLAFFVAPIMWTGCLVHHYRIIERYPWDTLMLSSAVYIVSNHLTGDANFSISDFGGGYAVSAVASVSGVMALLAGCYIARRLHVADPFAWLNRQALPVYGLQLVIMSLITSNFDKFNIPFWPWIAIQVLGACLGGYLIGSIAALIRRLSESKKPHLRK